MYLFMYLLTIIHIPIKTQFQTPRNVCQFILLSLILINNIMDNYRQLIHIRSVSIQHDSVIQVLNSDHYNMKLINSQKCGIIITNSWNNVLSVSFMDLAEYIYTSAGSNYLKLKKENLDKTNFIMENVGKGLVVDWRHSNSSM